jgi:hypothetical protein
MFDFLKRMRARKAAREAAEMEIGPTGRNQRVFDRTPMAADPEVPEAPAEARRDVFGLKSRID